MSTWTKFEGHLAATPRLPDDYVAKINGIIGRRNNTYGDGEEASFDHLYHGRWGWDGKGNSAPGKEGPWALGGTAPKDGQSASLVPGVWCCWRLIQEVDATRVEWNDELKFKSWTEWLQYLTDRIHSDFPDRRFSGKIAYCGVDWDGGGILAVAPDGLVTDDSGEPENSVPGKGSEQVSEISGRSRCCCINGLDAQFNEAYVKHELESYRKGGLGERAQRLLDFLKGRGLEGRTVLEIGSGIGALHLELLKAGAASAMGVDASPASVAAARDLATELGLAERVEYRTGDFTQLEGEVPPADIVLMDRVICCYPDMEALVGAAARHARAFCGLAYPRRGWWMRFFLWTGNVWGALVSSPYRAYYHEPKKVAATLTAAGFTEAFRATAGMWEVAVFGRGS